jgi:hypothetical protein
MADIAKAISGKLSVFEFRFATTTSAGDVLANWGGGVCDTNCSALAAGMAINAAIKDEINNLDVFITA